MFNPLPRLGCGNARCLVRSNSSEFDPHLPSILAVVGSDTVRVIRYPRTQHIIGFMLQFKDIDSDSHAAGGLVNRPNAGELP